MSAQTPGGRLSDAEVAQWAAPDTSRGAYVGKLAREVQEHRTMVERLKAADAACDKARAALEAALARSLSSPERTTAYEANERANRAFLEAVRAIIDAIAEPTDAAPQQKETP